MAYVKVFLEKTFHVLQFFFTFFGVSVCCIMMQLHCVAVRCCAMQCVAALCSAMRCITPEALLSMRYSIFCSGHPTCCSVLQHVAVYAVYYSVMHCVADLCSELHPMLSEKYHMVPPGDSTSYSVVRCVEAF